MNLTEARKAIGATRPIHAVTDWPPIGHAIAAMACGRAFEEPGRFVARELYGRHGRSEPRSYVLRDGGVTVHVRHDTADIGVLIEIFVDRVYEPPVQIMGVLDGLGRPPQIVDLGANIGLFGAFALGRWPGAEILAVEPDPANTEVHRLTLAANASASWRLDEAAAANADGELAFALGRFTESAALSGQHDPRDDERVQKVRAIDVLSPMASADLVKIDIEGGEWALLGDPRLRALQAAAMVLEYHPHLCPSPEPRTAAHEAMTSAGYETLDVPLPGASAGQGMLWAWRTDA